MAKRKTSQETFYGALILAFAFLLRLGSFRQYWHPKGYWIWHHIETDERIYQALVEQVNGNFWNYTMQGTELLPKLNPGVYDHPLFTHPPVFIYLSWFLEKVLHLPFPLVPVLQSLGTILCARWIALKLYKDEKTALWAMFLLTICPLSWFVSQKYWMESLLALTVSLQFLALLWALEKNDGKRFLLAGLAIALAYLTKFSAIFALPGVALLYVLRRGKNSKVSEVLLLTLPIVLLGGGWSLFALWKNGVVTTHIVDWDFAKFPFMQQVLARPWYYYFQTLVEFSPVYLLAF
ncbi:MAG TPA: glycosyltransferase family 39 protein, partial [Bdellovibrionota bacterium]